MLQLNTKAGLATSIVQELFTVSSAGSTLVLHIHSLCTENKGNAIPLQGISKHRGGLRKLSGVYQESQRDLPEDSSRQAFIGWIKRVIEGVKWIRDTYSKWSTSKCAWFPQS